MSSRVERWHMRFARAIHGPRMMHPAYTRLLPGVQTPPVVRLSDPGPAVWTDGLLLATADYYRQAQEGAGVSPPSLWDEQALARRDFLRALETNDVAALRAAFSDLFGGVLLNGMAHGSSLFAEEVSNPYERGFFGLRTLDCLLALAEARGVKAVANFAQAKLPRLMADLRPDVTALAAGLEDELGFSLDMPAAGAPYLADFGERRFAPDMLRHSYVAARLRELGLGQDDPILEIGGGFGMLAFLAARAGLGPYTILDLPFVGAIQHGWLGAVLGPSRVGGAHGQQAGAGSVTLLPPSSLLDEPGIQQWSMVVNCDSFPEIPADIARAYLRAIRGRTPYFLSINQEAEKPHNGIPQHRVLNLTREVGGFRRVYRFRHWLEQGYVEELYEVSS